jgi:hypothetical protein
MVKTVIKPTKGAIVWEQWNSKGGWVYAAQVGLPEDGRWKVGMTAKENPFERIHRLNKEVGTTERFDLKRAYRCVDRFWFESEMHKILNRYWESKEFFICSLKDIELAFLRVKETESSKWAGWNIDGWENGLSFEDWIKNAFDPDEAIEFLEDPLDDTEI